MKVLALVAAGRDLVDAEVELADASLARVRFDVSSKDDGSLASWKPDVFHDDPMPRGGVIKIVDAVRYFSVAVNHLDAPYEGRSDLPH